MLWDSTERLVRHIEAVRGIAELNDHRGLEIDDFCLHCAALFYYAGEAKYLSEKKSGSTLDSYIPPWEMEYIVELSGDVVSKNLGKILDSSQIMKVSQIIAESRGHFSEVIESMIISDARNLDDIGAIGLFKEFRKYAFEGKGVAEAVTGWKRKQDYRYWQARLREGFRFESVRKIAEKRLAAAELFMSEMGTEHMAEDVAEVTSDQAIAES
jgi:hypothetical protein